MSVIHILLLSCLLIPTVLIGQASENDDPIIYLRKQTKLSILNPGFELEIPNTLKSTLNIHVGVGYGGSYRNLTDGFSSGSQVLIAPFLDTQYRFYFNQDKRSRRGKNTANNSGTFFMLRGLIRGKGISSTFSRTSDTDFALGLGWGFQNYKKRLGWSFSIAPYYYFDGMGNSGFFPFIPEINVGYLLRKKRNP